MKNVIFDWSGTLSDDMFSCYTATMEVFRVYSIAEISFETFRDEIEYPYMKFYRKFCLKITKEEADIVFFKAIHRAPAPTYFEGADKILAEFHAKGIAMVVLSGVPEKKLRIESKLYGFCNYFKDIRGSVYDKTEIIHELMDTHGFSSKDTIYVGDMDHDIHAGKTAGVTTVAISWGYHSAERLKGEDPDYLIHSLEQLSELNLVQ